MSYPILQALRPSHFKMMADSMHIYFGVGGVKARLEICQFLTLIRATLPAWQGVSEVADSRRLTTDSEAICF